MHNSSQKRACGIVFNTVAVVCAAAVAAAWIDSTWAKTAVVVAGALSLCSAIYGGWWTLLGMLGTAGALTAFGVEGGWDSFPQSPGLVACGAVAGGLTVFFLVCQAGSGDWLRGTAGWTAVALCVGGAIACLLRPGGESIQRGELDECWDGLIVSNRPLLVGKIPGHESLELALPGGRGVPWSIGHAMLLSSLSGTWRVLDAGASFLPIRSQGDPVPFWVYLGGGGGEVEPVSTVKTSRLMGGDGA